MNAPHEPKVPDQDFAEALDLYEMAAFRFAQCSDGRVPEFREKYAAARSALLARFEAVRARQEWQPIETAPKDGTWVFLFVPGHGPARARWNGQSWMAHTNARQITRGTHWMPLPAPPVTALQAKPEVG
jgi:hypothetical protein